MVIETGSRTELSEYERHLHKPNLEFWGDEFRMQFGHLDPELQGRALLMARRHRRLDRKLEELMWRLGNLNIIRPGDFAQAKVISRYESFIAMEEKTYGKKD